MLRPIGVFAAIITALELSLMLIGLDHPLGQMVFGAALALVLREFWQEFSTRAASPFVFRAAIDIDGMILGTDTLSLEATMSTEIVNTSQIPQTIRALSLELLHQRFGRTRRLGVPYCEARLGNWELAPGGIARDSFRVRHVVHRRLSTRWRGRFVLRATVELMSGETAGTDVRVPVWEGVLDYMRS